MLESILSTTLANSTITLQMMIGTVFVSFALGVIVALTYIKTNDISYSNNFAITLLFMPAVMSTIILLIGNNIAGAFSLAGIFSIVRFRSATGNPKDIIYILFCLAAGVSVGIQSYVYGIIFVLFISIILFVLHYTKLDRKNSKFMTLKILIPEDLNYDHAFDEILKKYTKKYMLNKIGTKDLGSIYELVYDISINENVNKKEFIDELRCRNGNLKISLTLATENIVLS